MHPRSVLGFFFLVCSAMLLAALPAWALELNSRVFDPKLAGAELTVTSQRPGAGTYTAQLEVLDLQGQRVRRLVRRVRQRGRSYTDAWDGRDTSGRFVAPGDYQVRLSGGGAAEVSTLHVVRLGIRALDFAGSGRVPLSFHRAEAWSGSSFPVDNAGAAWTLPRSRLSVGCLDAADGSPLSLPTPWTGLAAPPRTSSGTVLQRGRSLPVAYRAGATPEVELTLGNAAAVAGQRVDCNLPVAGRPVRVWIEGAQQPGSMTGEVRPGERVRLDLPRLNRRLGKFNLEVRFRFAYLEDDGSWRSVPGQQTTTHTLYSVLGTPDVPGRRAWVAALDLVSRWLVGDVRSQDEALARVLRGVNEGLGLRYEGTQGAPAYTGGQDLASPELDLTAFLDNRARGLWVNCLDCASLVSQLAAQLGARGNVEIMGYDFRLNWLKGIGSADFTNALFSGYHAFSYHAVATFDRGATIHDACLSVDDDPRPWSAPFTARLPIGMPEARYRQQLGADTFYGRALGRATPR